MKNLVYLNKVIKDKIELKDEGEVLVMRRI